MKVPDEYQIISEKLKTFLTVLVNHSRTEWDGMDLEQLFLLLNQETHPKANDDLYTLEEVVEIIGMSVITIRQYVRMGRLKAQKVWRNWMVTSNEIARLMYEKKNGVEKKQVDTMLVIIDATLEDDDLEIATIHKYKFLSIDDAMNICGSEYNSIKVLSYERNFENSPTGSVLIEVVSNISNFFRKTGDIPFNEKNNENDLIKGYQVSQNVIQKVIEESSELMYSEVPLEDVKSLFGNPKETETLLKMYKTVLAFSQKINSLSIELQSKDDYIKELESKLKGD